MRSPDPHAPLYHDKRHGRWTQDYDGEVQRIVKTMSLVRFAGSSIVATYPHRSKTPYPCEGAKGFTDAAASGRADQSETKMVLSRISTRRQTGSP